MVTQATVSFPCHNAMGLSAQEQRLKLANIKRSAERILSQVKSYCVKQELNIVKPSDKLLASEIRTMLSPMAWEYDEKNNKFFFFPKENVKLVMKKGIVSYKRISKENRVALFADGQKSTSLFYHILKAYGVHAIEQAKRNEGLKNIWYI